MSIVFGHPKISRAGYESSSEAWLERRGSKLREREGAPQLGILPLVTVQSDFRRADSDASIHAREYSGEAFFVCHQQAELSILACSFHQYQAANYNDTDLMTTL